MDKYNKGDRVSWEWGDGRGYGTIKEKFKESVTRTLKGSEVTHNGSEEDPMILVEQSDGNEVLKLVSEIRKEP